MARVEVPLTDQKNVVVGARSIIEFDNSSLGGGCPCYSVAGMRIWGQSDEGLYFKSVIDAAIKFRRTHITDNFLKLGRVFLQSNAMVIDVRVP